MTRFVHLLTKFKARIQKDEEYTLKNIVRGAKNTAVKRKQAGDDDGSKKRDKIRGTLPPRTFILTPIWEAGQCSFSVRVKK